MAEEGVAYKAGNSVALRIVVMASTVVSQGHIFVDC